MKKGLFITGTSTDIGKTVCAAVICRILAGSGLKVAYYKPVQSGAVERDGKWEAPDCLFVGKQLRDFKGCTTQCTYLLKKAASPHFAARLERVRISLDKIKADYEALAADYDRVVVEGAGGLYVPLDDSLALIADIPPLLGLNTVLTAPAGLGTINHAALTYAFGRVRGIRITAIILVAAAENPTDIEKENAAVLKRITGLEQVVLIPPGRDIDENLDAYARNLAHIFPIGDWIDG